MSAPELPDAEQQAVRWWVASQSGQWSDDQQRELDDWLSADHAHRHAWERVGRTWLLSGSATRPDRVRPAANDPIAVRPPIPTVDPADARPKRNARTPVQALADLTAANVTSRAWQPRRSHGAGLAVALLVLALPAWQLAQPWWQGELHSASTARAEHKTVSLADGSTVQLGGDSAISWRIGMKAREVTLERGEALFSVQHQAWRPFAVNAGAGRVVDLGTRFTTALQPRQVQVVVLEGQVDLATPQGHLTLDAGQSAGYGPDGGLLPRVAAAEDAAAWQRGRRVIHDEPLGDVLARLARYYPVRFEIADPALEQLRISGSFDLTDLTVLLRTLEAAFPLRAQIVSREHVVLHAVPAS